MATLADSFLQDLEELNEDDNFEINDDFGDEEDDIIDAIEQYERTQTHTHTIVSDLPTQAHFKEILQKVREITEAEGVSNEGPKLKENDEYTLIDSCNELVINIDKEILSIHKFIGDIYSKKFPELESIVPSPLEYITIVQRVQNETDLTHVDLSDLLPNTVIMAVTVAGSMTTGSPLPPNELEKALGASEEAMNLALSRKEILMYLESRMNILAPNVTSLLGSSLTARLITHAGGLLGLARTPAQNIMLIGSSKRGGSFGFGAPHQKGNYGLIGVSEVVQNTSPLYRVKAIKMLASKCGLAARADSFHESPDGSFGHALREIIIKALIKIQEPPPAPQKRALPIPDEKAKTKRGGKRLRRMKEKYGLTELRKQTNRLKFGLEAEEDVGLEIGKGLGMLGVSTGTGKVRVQVKHNKVQTRKRVLPQQSSGATGGMSSSLIFTPIQGIELTNPDAQRIKQNKQQDGYFSNTGKFMKG